MKLTDEQRELMQTSIVFLKHDIWKKYTDIEEIEVLVIGNINHLESCIAKIESSEQAWREEALGNRPKQGLNNGLLDPKLVKIKQLKDQLNQAVKALKFYADENTYETNIGSLEIKPTAMIDKGHWAKTTLSSLSQEGETKRTVPDMSKITEWEYKALQWMLRGYGPDYLVNVIRQMEHISSLSQGTKE